MKKSILPDSWEMLFKLFYGNLFEYIPDRRNQLIMSVFDNGLEGNPGYGMNDDYFYFLEWEKKVKKVK